MVNKEPNPHRFDQRASLDPSSVVLRKILESLSTRPLVNGFDLEEMAPVFDVLPDLNFPITSAGHLLDQIETHKMVVHEIVVNPSRMIKHMPAYYFPISSYDNLIEKMGELIRANRTTVDPGEVDAIKRQLPPLRYPIKSGSELAQSLGKERTYRFQGGKVDVHSAVAQIPEHIFPIVSDADLDMKLNYMVRRRPLITGHKPLFNKPCS